MNNKIISESVLLVVLAISLAFIVTELLQQQSVKAQIQPKTTTTTPIVNFTNL
jgi:hypothetical protein